MGLRVLVDRRGAGLPAPPGLLGESSLASKAAVYQYTQAVYVLPYAVPVCPPQRAIARTTRTLTC